MDGTSKPAAKLRTRLLFEQIAGPSEREALFAQARKAEYEAGQLIFSKGDESRDVFVIVKGLVEFFLPRPRDKGQSIYLDEQGAGEYFGELGILQSQPRSASAKAKLDTTCMRISQSHVRSWLLEHPASALAMLGHAASRICDLSEHLQASMSSAYERVVRFINAVAVSEPATGARVISEMPLTTDLGRILGLSRERTSHILNDLARGGYIEQRGRRLIVKRSLPLHY